MSILQSAATRTFRDTPAMLTEGDMATLEAMGVSLFDLPDDEAEKERMVKRNAGRDMILGTWLATRDKAGKRAAFANPQKAIGDAFDWYESLGGGMDGMDVFYTLLNDRRNADVAIDDPAAAGSESGAGELPP